MTYYLGWDIEGEKKTIKQGDLVLCKKIESIKSQLLVMKAIRIAVSKHYVEHIYKNKNF